LRDVDDPSSSVEFINVNELDKFLEMAQGRMKKKVLAAAAAVRSGVDTVVLADANRHKPVQAALDGAGTRVGGGQP
jgi:[amino group carrier protein]-L-2-aminoadipate 6-kinase